jgi:D-arabinose 1-dehydrogenase-like Zn-dependent alcohol dehydrogenase
MLDSDGRICFVGAPAGMIELNPGQLIAKRLSVCGSPTGMNTLTIVVTK